MVCQTSSFASSNLTRVGYMLEPIYGQTPDPLDLKLLRYLTATPAANKQTTISDEIRPDRMVAAISEVGFDSGGTLGIEMNLGGVYDDWLEVALSGQWSTAINFTGALQVTAASRTIADSGAGGTAFTDATPGQWVYIQGMVNAGNNGWFKIEAVDSNDQITVEDPQTLLTDETGPGTATAKGKTLINGVCENSFTLELGFTDIMVFLLFNGQRPNWNISVAAGAIVTGGFDITGTAMQVADAEFGNSYAAAPITTPLNATANVGVVTKDGIPFTSAIQSIDLSVDNTYRSDQGIGSKFPVNVGYGRQVVSGTIVPYLQNKDNLELMLSHDKLGLAWDFVDIDGNAMHVEIPAIHFLTDPPGAEGTDQTVLESVDWQAVVDSSNTFQIRVDMA